MDMEINQGLISVIVPVYNVEPWLRECVDSILAQTYKNLEIILVDDGSKDGCPAICEEYAEKDSRIRVIHQENSGVSVARNRGIEVATGEYIALIDSDDVIDSNYCEYLYRACIETGSDISYCGIQRFEEGTALPTEPNQVYEETELRSFDSLYALQNCFPLWITPNVCAKMIRKTVFSKVRFPKGIMRAEDLAVVYYLIHGAKRVAGIKYCNLYHYRDRPDSAMHYIGVECLQDLDARMDVYRFFQTLPGCEETLRKFSDQTMRVFLGFALFDQNRVKDYRLFWHQLRRIKNELLGCMWWQNARTIREKLEMTVLAVSISAWLFLRKVECKLFHRPL